MKKRKKQILYNVIESNLIIFVLLVLFVNPSCSLSEMDDEVLNTMSKQACNNERVIIDQVYLDYDSNLEYLPFEKGILLDRARQRLDPYTIIQDDRVSYTISSGSEINISEDLFNEFICFLRITNQKIENGELLLIDGVLIDPEEDISINSQISLLREGGYNPNYREDTDLYSWGTRVSKRYNQSGALDYYNQYQGSSSSGIICGIASIGVGYINAHIGAIIAVLGMVSDYTARSIANKIFESARSGGIVIRTDYYYGGGSYSSVYSSNGTFITRIK